eukprot:scaffold76019_cov66-Phaeocystis_antarctica.AAC.14
MGMSSAREPEPGCLSCAPPASPPWAARASAFAADETGPSPRSSGKLVLPRAGSANLSHSVDQHCNQLNSRRGGAAPSRHSLAVPYGGSRQKRNRRTARRARPARRQTRRGGSTLCCAHPPLPGPRRPAAASAPARPTRPAPRRSARTALSAWRRRRGSKAAGSATSAGPHGRAAASRWALRGAAARPECVARPGAWRASLRRAGWRQRGGGTFNLLVAQCEAVRGAPLEQCVRREQVARLRSPVSLRRDRLALRERVEVGHVLRVRRHAREATLLGRELEWVEGREQRRHAVGLGVVPAHVARGEAVEQRGGPAHEHGHRRARVER